MNRYTTTILLSFTCAISLSAAVEGTVVNGTTGKPEPHVTVNLLKPGAGGMQQLATVQSDNTGHFRFQNDQPAGGPQLLQAQYKDVNYNKLLTPNMPTAGVDLQVYETTKSANQLREAQHLMVLEPSSSEIAVNETLIINNPSKTTYQNSAEGGIRFFLPPAANGQVRVIATGAQGMPLPQTPLKTEKTNIYKVDFALKPGQTEFQMTYVLPAGSPFTFRGKIANVKGMRTSPLRLVAPEGVSLTGNEVERVGQEPTTRATIFNVITSGNFKVEISGTGSLPGAQSANADGAAPGAGNDADQPQVTEGEPLIYKHLSYLVALALGILGLGLIALFRASPRGTSNTGHRVV